MSQRLLLIVGMVAITASIAIGGSAIAAGRLGNTQSISIDQAQQSVQSFLDRTGNRDLQIDEMMEFQRNFYALIKEKSTGIGAFELLVSRADGAVMLEPGPTMRWNTKYSPMGAGMMNGGWMGAGPYRIESAGTAMTVTPEVATTAAQSWLDHNFAGDSAGTPDAFYGYYTFHFERDGKIAGMLSVNGYSGEVWFHTWHGGFVQARDFGA